MSTVQDHEPCPRCDNKEATYELNCNTQEEWIFCNKCNYLVSWEIPRYGQEGLKALKELVHDGKPWHEVNTAITKLAKEMEEFNFGDEMFSVQFIVDSRGDFEALSKERLDVIKRMAHAWALFKKDDKGDTIWNKVEKYDGDKHIVSIPIKDLKPIGELLDEFKEEQ